jgi:cell division protein FtsI/penicillin-binding protein 2
MAGRIAGPSSIYRENSSESSLDFAGAAMRKPFQKKILWLMTIGMVAGFMGLGYRLVDLQVLQHVELGEIAQSNTRRAYYLSAPRGDIRDCNGNLLATSKLIKTVCADPTLICNKNVGNRQAEVVQVLSPILQMSEAELFRLIQTRILTNKAGKLVPDQYVVLKHKVGLEDWQRLTNAMHQINLGMDDKGRPLKDRYAYQRLRASAIFSEDDQLRVYPNKNRAAHVLGYVGTATDSQTSNSVMAAEAAKSGSLAGTPEFKRGDGDLNMRRPVEVEGKDGVEKTLDQALKGVPGWRATELDVARHELVAFRDQDVPARPGLTAMLTLDLGLQEILETELADAAQKHSPVSISGIIIRPATGEVLAMATLPNFDPNNPGAFDPNVRRNRVITDLAEPGSTYKIVVVTGALNEKKVTPTEMFDCEQGHFVFAGRVLRDHERYGLLSVEQIITKSSNIGAAKIGIKMGADMLYRYERGFGFGERTGIELPGERIGLVYAPEHWNKLSISRIPMGQEVAVTPMQMVMAMSAIANGGRLMRPWIVNRLQDENGKVVQQYEPQMVRQVCTEATARQMVAALKTVAATNGTASKAQLENYIVAGKTGTAQKSGGRAGYLPGKYFSSFIGFFPADRPELCISVVMDEPRNGYYGGQAAAPCFHNIGERAAKYLSIRPDSLTVDIMAMPQRTNRLTTARSR